ncbi:helix-turn-helix domain-containing protein [Staphylococcus haemolyticus]|uniref:helix-turn-helix domain-containing protein n=1 Tax=Staphylococcus haemolyticus TaxID=1283 RepID=UPI0020BF793C|nr:helix-turn-helix transcriptional regulator [Staphylococcus haemolyticus]
MILCTLKNLIETHNKTQSEISEATGITRPTLLSLIKNENKSIRYETINQLCNYFEIDMSDLLIYSPVNVELKKILIEEFPFSIYMDLEKGEMSYLVSIIYNIDGIEIEFDTNLNVTKKSNSLKTSNKVFFSSVIYEDELMKLNSKGFDFDFIKLYNSFIDLDLKIKEKLIAKNLNIDFSFENYIVGISSMERYNGSEKELKSETSQSLEKVLKLGELSDEETEILTNIIKKYQEDLNQKGD